ncbi:MAG TPA: hypothetical protein VK430_03225 [Xanthobacteraceae bacterium]|nr:hypothetical protein [Xanthobacteraceae bacterium]
MSVSAISSAAGAGHMSSLHATQASGHHRHGGRHAQSISDVDAQGSSVASPPSPTGKIGSKIDVTA